LLENILTVRPRLKKQGSSQQVSSASQGVMEQKGEKATEKAENNEIPWAESMLKMMENMMGSMKEMHEEVVGLRISVTRVEEKMESLVKNEEKSLKTEKPKKASYEVKSKVKGEVKVSRSIQKPVIESKKDCEVVEEMTVREEEIRYLVMNRAGKGYKVGEIKIKSGAEIKLCERRAELKGTKEMVGMAKEMVRAVCKETVVIHIGRMQAMFLKKSGRACRIEEATGAMVQLESNVKKEVSSTVCICGTREEVAAARDLLEQNTVTETVSVAPEVVKFMRANNYSEKARIQKTSGAFLYKLNMDTMVMVGSKEEVGEARRMVLDLVSMD